MQDKFRLVTRSDFDGLIAALLLKELDLINDIKFVHPKDVQDGLIDIQAGDIVTNLPYDKNAAYVFDHHISELARVGKRSNHFLNPNSPSASRVIWDAFGGKETFKNVSEEMMAAVDKADSANFTREDILNPTGWTLLNFIMDARTGLGRYNHFRISNYQLMMNLIDFCRLGDPEDIFMLPDVKERVDFYFENQERFKEQLKRQTKIYKNLAYVDMLNDEEQYPGNRFMVYVLFPEVNISMHALWRINGERILYAVGKSIFNRTNIVNIGELLLQYGGGGHATAGTCQTGLEDAVRVREELIALLTDDKYTVAAPETTAESDAAPEKTLN